MEQVQSLLREVLQNQKAVLQNQKGHSTRLEALEKTIDAQRGPQRPELRHLNVGSSSDGATNSDGSVHFSPPHLTPFSLSSSSRSLLSSPFASSSSSTTSPSGSSSSSPVLSALPAPVSPLNYAPSSESSDSSAPHRKPVKLRAKRSRAASGHCGVYHTASDSGGKPKGAQLLGLLSRSVGSASIAVGAGSVPPSFPPYWYPGIDLDTSDQDDVFKQSFAEYREKLLNDFVRTCTTTKPSERRGDSSIVDAVEVSSKTARRAAVRVLDSHADRPMSESTYVDILHVLLRPSLLERHKDSQLSEEDRDYWKRMRRLFTRSRFFVHYMSRDLREIDPSLGVRNVPVLHYVKATVGLNEQPSTADCIRAVPAIDIGRFLSHWHKHTGHHAGIHEAVKQQYANITREHCTEFVRHCSVCTKSLTAPRLNKAPLTPIVHFSPRERYTLDLMDMKEENGIAVKNLKGVQYRRRAEVTKFRYIGHMIDHATKYAWAGALMDKTKAGVSTWVEGVWVAHGKPAILHTDNGGEFKNWMVEAVCRRWGTRMVNGRPLKPSTQGVIERANRSLRTCLHRNMEEHKTLLWTEVLQITVSHRNTRRHSTTKQIPAVSFASPSIQSITASPLPDDVPVLMQ